MILSSVLSFLVLSPITIQQEPQEPESPVPLVSPLIPLKPGYEPKRVYAIEAEKWYIKLGFWNEKARIAMLANALKESGFDPKEESRERDGSVSRGFHQLNSRGVGRGLDRHLQLQIRHNVFWILNTKSAKEWYRDHKKYSWSAGKSAYEFAKRVERCRSEHWPARRTLANSWEKALEALHQQKEKSD